MRIDFFPFLGKRSHDLQWAMKPSLKTFSGSGWDIYFDWDIFKFSWDETIIGVSLNIQFFDKCFIQPMFSSFVFWYFGHLSSVIFFLLFPSCLSCLAKCKERYVIFSHFHYFVAKWLKTKSEKWDERNSKILEVWIKLSNYSCSMYLLFGLIWQFFDPKFSVFFFFLFLST